MVGIAPETFWQITPWQQKLLSEAHGELQAAKHENILWQVWHTACFSRMKKLPEYKDLFKRSKRGSAPNIDQGAIMARLKAYSKRYKEQQGQ